MAVTKGSRRAALSVTLGMLALTQLLTPASAEVRSNPASAGTAYPVWAKVTPAMATTLPTPATTPTVAVSTPTEPTAPEPTASEPAEPNKPSKGTVYLTFDDGPDPRNTPEVLALLEQYDAQATFFVMGSRSKKYPKLLAAVRDGGHAVGNHTWSHPDLTRLSAAKVRWQFAKANAVIGTTPCMRPPYGATDATVRKTAKSLKLREVMWTVDTVDWKQPKPKTIAKRVLRDVQDGSIVLMHDGGGDRSHTVAALKTMLPQLTKAGWDLEALPYC